MEIEQLKFDWERMRTVEKRDPEEILPAPDFPVHLSFHENKSYVRHILATQIDLTSKFTDFTPVSTLPPDDRYFAYQRTVNAGGVPSEDVIRMNAGKNGQ